MKNINAYVLLNPEKTSSKSYFMSDTWHRIGKTTTSLKSIRAKAWRYLNRSDRKTNVLAIYMGMSNGHDMYIGKIYRDNGIIIWSPMDGIWYIADKVGDITRTYDFHRNPPI